MRRSLRAGDGNRPAPCHVARPLAALDSLTARISVFLGLGCPDVSAHGLRKATARRLAEIGCSANQIASVTGHASLSEVQRYTRAADRKRMAREAMKKLIEGGW